MESYWLAQLSARTHALGSDFFLQKLCGEISQSIGDFHVAVRTFKVLDLKVKVWGSYLAQLRSSDRWMARSGLVN